MPNFVYTDNLPNPPNLPSQDVNSMQVNCNSVEGWAEIDHFGFNDNSGGYHKQVSMPNQATPVLPGLMNGVLFATGGNPWWQNAAAGTPFKFALINQNNIAANGYISLGGVIFQWGSVNAPGATGTVNFPLAFPSGNPPFTVQISVRRDGSTSTQGAYIDGAPLAASFKYTGSSNSAQTLFWFAVGV